MTTTNPLVAKIWNYCHTLRDDGMGYGDYLEQLTYLLFLKIADEYSKSPHHRDTQISEELAWESLLGRTGADLETQYIRCLPELGWQTGMIGQIFFKAQNKIQNPAKLYKLVQLINAETWTMLDVDVKGEVYEGSIEKNAENTKSGAGQYFTPRALIRAMVEWVRPQPMKTIADPACSTGGFFLAAYDYISQQPLDIEEKKFLKYNTLQGWEIVPNTVQLCLMNLYLHNIGDLNPAPPIDRRDSLFELPRQRFGYVLANPPFGKKSSTIITNKDGDVERESLTCQRQDFWATTANKQLNFMQHIRSMLKIDGQAAVVLPDNVLFEGRAGEQIWKQSLRSTDLHTILRLPTGIFYAQGVKANVLFFDNKPASRDSHTHELWVYDYRTNVKHTLKTNPLQTSHLADFVTCYRPGNRECRQESDRFRRFGYAEITARDKTSLDIFWLKDDSLSDLDNLSHPDEFAGAIVENFEAALVSFRTVASQLA